MEVSNAAAETANVSAFVSWLQTLEREVRAVINAPPNSLVGRPLIVNSYAL